MEEEEIRLKIEFIMEKNGISKPKVEDYDENSRRQYYIDRKEYKIIFERYHAEVVEGKIGI